MSRAEQVKQTLAAHPEGMTAPEIAKALGLGTEQVRSILSAKPWAITAGVKGEGRQVLFIWKVKEK